MGRLICGNIRGCVDRVNGRLLYPAIIHGLMAQANVRTLPTNSFNKEKTIMDKKSLDRLMRFGNNPPKKNPNVVEALEEMRDALLKEMREATA